ncbi:MAG: nucleotide exchange factor GrpE [Vitreimonas sp.]
MTNEAEPNAAPETTAPEAAPAPDSAALQAELTKARDEMLRALAEVENTRRRAERQAADARAYAIDRFANDLLPVADTLARALGAAPRDDLDEGFRNLLTGVELTERAMLEAFARHGLTRVGAKGEVFDPNIHQAVAQAPSDRPAGIVLEVLQPGYVLGERTLRAAMVLVSAGGGAQSAAPTADIKV